MLSDLTTAEFIELVRRVVREELSSRKSKPPVPAPGSSPSKEAVARVRRSLRRQGVAA